MGRLFSKTCSTPDWVQNAMLYFNLWPVVCDCQLGGDLTYVQCVETELPSQLYFETRFTIEKNNF